MRLLAQSAWRDVDCQARGAVDRLGGRVA
jgi:hypothetical protein